MRPLEFVLRGESPVVLARELVWRTRKQWNKKRLPAQVRKQCLVSFRARPYYRPRLELCTEQARNRIVSISDLVCRGEFPFLGYGTVPLGMPPPWNLDFVCGKDWRIQPVETLVVVRHDGSDVKVPWELSRLQMLPVLGKAHLLTGRKGYRAAARALVSDWIRLNPVGMGVNWTVAMEAALRATSICLLLNLLSPFRPEEEEWVQAVTKSLWEHLLFIEAHSEFSHIIRSNHYLSNLLGLLCLSIFLEGGGMAERRAEYSQRLQREIFRQVYADGGDYEASTGYHVLVTQMFTTALLLMRADGIKPAHDFLERLRGMHRFIAELADEQGRLPHVGDCDDGRTELLSDDLEQMLSVPVPERYSLRVGGLVGVGSALFGEAWGSTSDDALWYGLAAEPSSHSGNWAAPRHKPVTIFPDSGVAVARNHQAEVLLFAIPNGLCGKGSHTHNDKLSVAFRLMGEELLCDSGTCFYTRHRDTRNEFRSTASHNTARIDGQEQNTVPDKNNGLFCLGNEAQVAPIRSKEMPGGVELESAHEGYGRIGVLHSRVVRLRERSLQLEDRFEGGDEHQIELNFHVSDGWELHPAPEGDPQTGFQIRGPHHAGIRWQAPVPLKLTSERVSISRCYGATSPATRIVVAARALLPFAITTHLCWGP